MGQPSELIITQLQYLPIEEVLSVCEGNVRLAQICNTTDFWFRRLARDFPGADVQGTTDPRALYLELYWQRKVAQEFGADVASLKPSGVSYRDQYKYLKSISDHAQALVRIGGWERVNGLLERVALDDRLDILLLLNRQLTLEQNPGRLIAAYGRLNPELIQQLKHLEVFNIGLLNSALFAGNLHNVQLLIQEGLELRDDLANWVVL